jgi:hypothetical protein
MAEFHQHPDNWIYVRTPGGVYMDLLENFVLDFGVDLPPLPDGAGERIYTQGRRHALMGDGNVVAGGDMPWPLGDAIIADVLRALEAQQTRREARTERSGS